MYDEDINVLKSFLPKGIPFFEEASGLTGKNTMHILRLIAEDIIKILDLDTI